MPKLIFSGPSSAGAHRLESFSKCPQQYSYLYNLNLKSDEPAEPLVFGSISHTGWAHHYKRKQLVDNGEDPDEFYSPIDAMELAAASPEFKGMGYTLVDDCIELYEAYLQHWGPNENFRVLHVEDEFEALVAGKYKYTARFDLVVEDSGLVYAWDHKAVYKIESRTVDRYTLSTQFLGQQKFGQTVWGSRFGGVRLNLAQKRKPHAFARVNLDYAPNMLERFPSHIEYVETRIAELKASNTPFDKYPAALSEQVCISPYGRCQFFELCQFGLRTKT